MRKLFLMKCPRCGHHYQYEGEEYGYESCPMPECYKGKFRDFVAEEHLPEEDKAKLRR